MPNSPIRRELPRDRRRAAVELRAPLTRHREEARGQPRQGIGRSLDAYRSLARAEIDCTLGVTVRPRGRGCRDRKRGFRGWLPRHRKREALDARLAVLQHDGDRSVRHFGASAGSGWRAPWLRRAAPGGIRAVPASVPSPMRRPPARASDRATPPSTRVRDVDGEAPSTARRERPPPSSPRASIADTSPFQCPACFRGCRRRLHAPAARIARSASVSSPRACRDRPRARRALAPDRDEAIHRFAHAHVPVARETRFEPTSPAASDLPDGPDHHAFRSRGTPARGSPARHREPHFARLAGEGGLAQLDAIGGHESVAGAASANVARPPFQRLEAAAPFGSRAPGATPPSTTPVSRTCRGSRPRADLVRASRALDRGRARSTVALLAASREPAHLHLPVGRAGIAETQLDAPRHRGHADRTRAARDPPSSDARPIVP